MYSQIRNISIACIILIALGGVPQATATEEEMRAAMQGMLDALNAQDAAQMSLYWTDDIVYDFVAQTPPLEGKDEVAAFFGGLFQGVPDFHSTQTHILVSGNIMVTEAMGTGTHLGELGGIPATGNSLQMLPLHIWEFEGDKVKRATEYLDMASTMVQLGVMPAPEPLELVPSFTLPDAEPTGLTPLEAFQELLARWNAQDLPGFAKMLHPDAEIFDTGLGVPVNRDAYVAAQEMNFQGFSDMRGEIVRVIDMGDGWVSREVVFTGTHDGPFMGFPATGRTFTLRAAGLLRFDADGLVTNFSLYYDNLGMMQQITAQTIPEGLVVDQITSPSLEGNLLGDPSIREVIVYLPPSYNQGGNFPVVYLLHGYTGNARTFASNAYTGFYWPAESDFPEGGIYGLLNDLIAAGELKEMIVVMPDASNMYGGSWYANSELTGNYEDYIVEDLVSYIDSNYRTIPSRDSRAIVGHSMGGYGAMKLAMKHSDVFGAVASHGGALYLEVLKALLPAVIEENPTVMTGPAPDKPMTSVCYSMSAAFSPNLANPPFFVDLPFDYPSPEIIDEVWDRFMEHDVLTMLGTHGANVASLRGIYMDAGAQDEFASNFQTDAFHQALDVAGIGHEYEIYSGTHYDRVFEKLTISLKFLSDALGD